MRAFAVWLAVFVLGFGGYAFAVDQSRASDPEQVFVVVDSSFPMEGVWSRVPGTLDDLEGERYTEYALATEKAPIHSWREELDFDAGTTPFAPCDFGEVSAYPEAEQADRVVVVTVTGSCAADEVPQDWEVLLVDG